MFYMIEKEKLLVSSLVKQNLLKDNAYLVKDGSLEYSRINEKDEFSYNKIKDNYNYVIGVSKQFNPSLLKDKNNKSLAKTIAELPLFRSDHLARACCITVLPEPKGPGIAAVPPLAMGNRVSMIR